MPAPGPAAGAPQGNLPSVSSPPPRRCQCSVERAASRQSPALVSGSLDGSRGRGHAPASGGFSMDPPSVGPDRGRIPGGDADAGRRRPCPPGGISPRRNPRPAGRGGSQLQDSPSEKGCQSKAKGLPSSGRPFVGQPLLPHPAPAVPVPLVPLLVRDVPELPGKLGESGGQARGGQGQERGSGVSAVLVASQDVRFL